MEPHRSISTASAADKLPAVEIGDTHSPDRAKQDLEPTTGITQDENGNTVITREDGEVFVIDHKAERALVWKFDLRILPMLAMMYLFNALDKANLGNAKTAGKCQPLVCFEKGWRACRVELKCDKVAPRLTSTQASKKTSVLKARTSTTFCYPSSSYPTSSRRPSWAWSAKSTAPVESCPV